MRFFSWKPFFFIGVLAFSPVFAGDEEDSDKPFKDKVQEWAHNTSLEQYYNDLEQTGKYLSLEEDIKRKILKTGGDIKAMTAALKEPTLP